MDAPSETTTVGQIVVDRPARSRVFEGYKIDYCCGGGKPLGQACQERGLDVQEVIDALRASDAGPSSAPDEDWSQTSLSALIDHILTTHHAYLRRELPRLMELTEKVRQAHGERHRELIECRALVADLRAELESHMYKEENILFPMIQIMESSGTIEASHCGSITNPIRVMEAEHDSAGSALSRLRELTSEFTPPPDACNTWRAWLDVLHALEADLHQHIHKENNILFPRAIELESTFSQEAPFTAA